MGCSLAEASVAFNHLPNSDAAVAGGAVLPRSTAALFQRRKCIRNKASAISKTMWMKPPARRSMKPRTQTTRRTMAMVASMSLAVAVAQFSAPISSPSPPALLRPHCSSFACWSWCSPAFAQPFCSSLSVIYRPYPGIYRRPAGKSRD